MKLAAPNRIQCHLQIQSEKFIYYYLLLLYLEFRELMAAAAGAANRLFF